MSTDGVKYGNGCIGEAGRLAQDLYQTRLRSDDVPLTKARPPQSLDHAYIYDRRCLEPVSMKMNGDYDLGSAGRHEAHACDTILT